MYSYKGYYSVQYSPNISGEGKGYYSIIQYFPNLARQEGVNIGLILHSPIHSFLKCQILSEVTPLLKFLKLTNQELEAYKDSIEHRLKFINNVNDSVHQQLENYINTRANKIQLTPLNSLRVTDPEKQLKELFEELVM